MMGDCFEISKILGKTKQMIYRVGVELEGGWKKLPDGVKALVRDGSIVIEPEIDVVTRMKLQDIQYRMERADTDAMVRQLRALYKKLTEEAGVNLTIGELPSDILEPARVSSWMRQSYPHVVNSTCGMHVHMSFKSALNYQRLMVEEYQNTIIAGMIEWSKDESLDKDHPIWPRLYGKSKYCQHKFNPDIQATKVRKEYDQQDDGNRYTVINYAFHLTGTIECRLLPMMQTAEQGIRAVQRIMDITNASLVASAKKYREEKVSGELVMDNQLGLLRNEKVEHV